MILLAQLQPALYFSNVSFQGGCTGRRWDWLHYRGTSTERGGGWEPAPPARTNRYYKGTVAMVTIVSCYHVKWPYLVGLLKAWRKNKQITLAECKGFRVLSCNLVFFAGLGHLGWRFLKLDLNYFVPLFTVEGPKTSEVFPWCGPLGRWLTTEREPTVRRSNISNIKCIIDNTAPPNHQKAPSLSNPANVR